MTVGTRIVATWTLVALALIDLGPLSIPQSRVPLCTDPLECRLARMEGAHRVSAALRTEVWVRGRSRVRVKVRTRVRTAMFQSQTTAPISSPSLV